MTSKLILGFVGLPASGKGTAAEYLKTKYGANTFRYSTMLWDLLTRLYLEPTRDNLIKMSECVREKFGEDTMAKVITKDVENSQNKLIIVEGIRRMADIEYMDKLPNFILVEIFADIEKRYKRIMVFR